MSDEIFFDGIRYISASDASRESGFTQDHVARLCREGKITGKQIGKNWYLSLPSFQKFVLTQAHAHFTPSDEIVFNDVRYISATAAGREAGLTRDHVARLCREEKILGKHVGKNWYVSLPSFQAFILTQAHAHFSRSEELSRQRTSEYRAVNAESVASGKQISPAPPRTNASSVSPAPKHRPIGTNLSAANFKNSSLAPHLWRDVSPLNRAQVERHAVSPALELLHKLTAIAVALSLTLGTYTLVDKDFARFAKETMRNTALAVSDPERILAFGISAKNQLAAVALDPAGTFMNAMSRLARSFNEGVDDVIYAVAFSGSLREAPAGLFDSGTRGTVAVGIGSYTAQSGASASSAAFAENTGTAAETNTRPSQNTAGAAGTTIINNPVVERIIQTDRIVAQGGISEEILNRKLEQLNNKLSSQMFSLSSANSTQIAQTYQVVAQSNKIDQLDSVAISNSSISGSTITNTSVSATGLSVSGTTDLASLTAASATVTGNVGIGGSLSLSGTTTALSAANATFTNATTTNATSTNLFSTNASTTNATSTNLFSVLGHFTTGVIDTLTSTLATLTSLTATELVATNATSTNFYATTASSTNLYSTSATFGVLSANSAALTSATTTNLFSTTASSTNLYSTSAAFGVLSANSAVVASATTTNLVSSSATSTNLFSTTASSTNLFSTNANLGVLTAGTLSLTAGTTTNFFSTTASSTNLFSQLATLGTLAVGGNATVGGTLTVSGLCVTGDTKLRRRRRRKDGSYDYDEPEIVDIKDGDEIQSLDEKTGKLVWSRVKQLAFMGVKQTYKLTTASGKTIRTTANHPYLARKGRGATMKAPAGKGDMGPAHSNSGVGGKLREMDVHQPSRLVAAGPASDPARGKATDIASRSFSRTFAFIDASNLYYGAKEKNYRIDFKKLACYFRMRYGVSRIFYYTGLNVQSISQIGFYAQLEKYGYELRYVRYKAFGNGDDKADVDARMATDMLVLAGEYNRAIVVTGDGDFFWTLQHLLQSGKELKLFGYANRTARELKQLLGSRFTDFLTLHAPINRTEKTNATDTVMGSAAGSTETLYSSVYELSMMPRRTPVDKKQAYQKEREIQKLLEDILYGTEEGNNVRPGEGTWRKVGELKEGMEIAVAAPQGGAAWDRIVSVEPAAEEDVYDIEVEGTHNFIGNGIVAHNTALFNQASTTLFSSYGPAYFGATATSTFSGNGSLTLPTAALLTAPFASSTALTVSGSTYLNGNTTLASATTTNLFSTVASSTNLYAQAASVGTLAATGATTLSSTLGVTGLATLGNLSLTAGTTTNFFSTTASSTNLYSTSATFGVLSANSAALTSATTTNLFSTTASSTNLFAQTASLGSLTISGGLTSGGLATFTSGFLSNASSTITSGLFSMNGGASTTALTISGSSWLGTPLTLVGTNITGTGASFTAGKATVLETARTINGISFDGSANITVASTTLLANNNTWTGLNAFSNATSTLFTSTTAWIDTLNLTNDLTVANGGTGASTLTGLLQGNGTGAITGITGTAGQFPYYNGTNTLLATSTLFVSTAGNVGIGTTTPSTKLEISGTSGEILRIASTKNDGSWTSGQVQGALEFYGNDASGAGVGVLSAIRSVNENSTFGGKSALVFTTSGDLPSTAVDQERMRIDKNGNVGIGTTSPAYKLTVNSTNGTDNLFQVATTTNQGIMVINNQGNVGIGTTTPYSKLVTWGTGSLFEAVTNASTTVFSIGQGGATSTAFFATTASSTNLFAQTAAIGSLTANTLTVNSTLTQTGLATFTNGFISNASSTITSGLFSMNGGASTTHITASGTGYFGLGQFTNTSGTTTIASGQGFTIGSSQLVVQQGSGNVGIGTTAPGYKLHVTGPVDTLSDYANVTLASDFPINNTGRIYTGLLLRDTNTWNAGAIGYSYDGTGYKMHFATATNTSPNNLATSMTIDRNGNVGIGTTGPSTKLHVYGSVAASGSGANAAGTTATIENAGTGVAQLVLDGDTRKYRWQQLGSGQTAIMGGTVGTGVGLYSDSDTAWPIAVESTAGTGLNTRIGTGAGYFHNTAYGSFIYGSAWNVVNYYSLEINSASGDSNGNPGTLALKGSVQSGSGATNFIDFYNYVSGDTYRQIGAVQYLRDGADNSSKLILKTANAGTLNSALTIDKSGNVGIGTTTPDRKLDVFGGDIATNEFLRIKSWDGTYGTGNGLIWYDGVGGSGDATGYLALRGGGSTDDLVIQTSSGNVGIGTTGPAALLHVQKSVDGSTEAARFGNKYYNAASSDDEVYVTLGVGDSNSEDAGGVQLKAKKSGAHDTVAASDVDFIITNEQNNAQVETFRILGASGNVGIGTTAPGTYKLNVNGTMNVTGASSASISMQGYRMLNTDATDVYIGNLDASYRLLLVGGGTAYFYLATDGGLYSASATGGSKGAQTINILGDVYKNGTAYTNPDYVFEKYYTGNIVRFASNEGASTYTGLQPLSDVKAFAEANYVLPRVADWRRGMTGSTGLFGGSDAILASIEESYLYLFNHEDRIKGLEVLTSFIANSATSTAMTIDASGNVGIGTTTPQHRLQVAGDVAAESFVNNSTRGVKTDITGLATTTEDSILEQLATTNVYSYRYPIREPMASNGAGKDSPIGLMLDIAEAPSEVLSVSGDGVDIYKLAVFTLAGVKAQSRQIEALNLNLESIISANGGIGGDTPLESQEPLTGQASFAERFFSNIFARITAWLADAANGVGKFFAGEIHTDSLIAKKASAKELCVSDNSGAETCVTKAQLDALLAGVVGVSDSGGVTSATPDLGVSPPSGTATTTDTTAPIITLNGNNPAIINIGDSYGDLGALITGPTTEDTNLGIHVSVDGGATTTPDMIAIDTSVAGTHTILYSATNQAGETGYAERTVNVLAPNAALTTYEVVNVAEATSTSNHQADIGT